MAYRVEIYDGHHHSDDADWEVVVSSKEDADKLESKILHLFEGTYYERSGKVVISPVPEPVTVEEALADLEHNNRFEELFEDEEEKANQAKVEGIVQDDMDKLADTWNGNPGTARRTTVPATGYNRDPWADDYPDLEDNDPFAGMPDEEFDALTDEEFLEILENRRKP